jgi:hypothetical protein
MDKTVGVLWEAGSGTVNPWKLADINSAQDTDIARASNVTGKPVVTSAEVVTRKQEASKQEIENHLRSQGAHPDQADWGLSLEKARSGIILVLAVGLGVYFLFEFGKAYLSRR